MTKVAITYGGSRVTGTGGDVTFLHSVSFEGADTLLWTLPPY